MLSKKLNVYKKKWTSLPEYSPLFKSDLEDWNCCFAEDFNFETIIFGKKMEKDFEQLKQYIDESHIENHSRSILDHQANFEEINHSYLNDSNSSAFDDSDEYLPYQIDP